MQSIWTQINKLKTRRKDGDSNPRYRLTGTHAFQACTLNHSDIFPNTNAKKNRSQLKLSLKKKRKERDSNPRYAYAYNGFRDRPNRPLSHLSRKILIQALPVILLARLGGFEPPTFGSAGQHSNPVELQSQKKHPEQLLPKQ